MTKIDNCKLCKKIKEDIENGRDKGRLAVVLKDSAKREYRIIPEIEVFCFGFPTKSLAFIPDETRGCKLEPNEVEAWFRSENERRREKGIKEVPSKAVSDIINTMTEAYDNEDGGYSVEDDEVYLLTDKDFGEYEIESCSDILDHSDIVDDRFTFFYRSTKGREYFVAYIPEDECINCSVWED